MDSCSLEERWQQYIKIATKIATEEGDEKFYRRIEKNKISIHGTTNFHPILGPLFISMFPNADMK